MFRFTIRDLLWLMVVVGLAFLGCGKMNRKVETVRRGTEEVDRHAKEIEEAAKP